VSNRFVNIFLAIAPGRRVLLQVGQVWAAFPNGPYARLYLRDNMEPIIRPSDITPDLTAEMAAAHLVRALMLHRMGSTVDANCTVADAAAALELELFYARDQQGGTFPVAVHRDHVVSVCPAFTPDNKLVGSNIFTKGITIETNGSIIPVSQTPDEVIAQFGFHPSSIKNVGKDMDHIAESAPQPEDGQQPAPKLIQ